MTTTEVKNYYATATDITFPENSNKHSQRKDLNAFLIIDRLLPNKTDYIIAGATHDVIYLSLDPDEIPDVATLNDLFQCGVNYNSLDDYFYMFV